MSDQPPPARTGALAHAGPLQSVPDEGPTEKERSLSSWLQTLVHHRDQVDARMPLSEVQKIFQKHPGDFRAIVDGHRVVGLCSRATIGFMLGSRYGFSLYGDSPVMSARAPRPLIYTSDTPLPHVMDEALSRTGSEFFEDLIVVENTGALIGLVPVPNLAKLQLQLHGEQLRRVVSQDGELRQQNLELFQINHQLRQSQGRYKALFENNALGVALLDAEGGIVAHNLRFEQLLQLTEGPLPQTFFLEQWLNPGDVPVWQSLLAGLEKRVTEAKPRVTQFEFALPRGPRLFELHTSWVVETGQVCVFLEDITEEHSLEQRMAQQEKQSMLDTLVAGVAHELNNKLTPVMGFAELLHTLTPPGELQEHSHIIRQSAHEAAQIIRQLLNLSRPSGGTFELFDPATICQEVVQMLRFQMREARCEADIQSPAQAAYVDGDPSQIKQVLINLVLNALHAMEEQPRPSLTISITTDEKSVWLRVRDAGSGISPEIMKRIFDPYFTTKGPRGTGLGLSISSSIIRQHGGELTVESTPGKGSTFSIRLPVNSPTNHPTPVSAPPMIAEIFSGSARRRTLIVDDEEFVRQFMQEALRVGFGCAIETAADGMEAVEKLREGGFDLILSDIRMPRMDGLQLRSWIAAHRPELAERVVFVTGHAGTAELDRAIGSLGCQVIRKPFTIEAIMTACRPYLE